MIILDNANQHDPQVEALIYDLQELSSLFVYHNLSDPEAIDRLVDMIMQISTYHYDQGLHDVDVIKDTIRYRLQSWSRDEKEFNAVYRKLLELWYGT
jgi:hypothetical protein